MAITNSSKFAPKFSSALDIDSIISAPLVAASKANATMLKGQIKFLLDFCFNRFENEENGAISYEPVMIRMMLKRNIPRSQGSKTWMEEAEIPFEVPLLILIPITTLAVTSLSLDFNLEIISHTERREESQRQEQDEGGPSRKTKLIGKVGKGTTSRQLSTNVTREDSADQKAGLNVTLEAESIDLPLGLTSIIDLYSKSIAPLASEGKISSKTV